MRGKAGTRYMWTLTTWITPAYAGKSFAFLKFRPPTRDHPRLCGEKPNVAAITSVFRGSPPPMRGKENPDRKMPALWGITPAYAGKSVTFWLQNREIQDHPRLCGEKPQTAVLFLRRSGSPPPMRGKGRVAYKPRFTARITPAYAGKSFWSTSTFGVALGSPPPMRGKELLLTTVLQV